MTDTDEWLICKKCGKAFENWSTIGTTVGRCLKCARKELRDRHGAPQRKRPCLLCGKEFDVPSGLGAATKYCLDHRGMDTHERKRAFAIRDGQPVKQRRFAQKTFVDRTVYVNINYLMSNRCIEKIVKTLQDKNVRLVR